jgi:hypothetical protein
VPELEPDRIDALMDKWTKRQRKLKRNNILVSLAFIAVFADLAWVYISFRAGHTALFGGSILAMGLCMLMYLWVMWRGVSYETYDPAAASNIYIDKYLQKLFWQRTTITTYSWIYAMLLWLAFMFYSYELTRNASLTMKITIPAAVTVYIFGMFTLFRFTKKKKQLKIIDELINEMIAIKDKMELL